MSTTHRHLKSVASRHRKKGSEQLLLIYECGDYSRFELAEMDPDVYDLYFAGKDWDEFNADEQIIIEGGTCYVCVF